MIRSCIKKTDLIRVCSMPCCQNKATAVITVPDDIAVKKIFICDEHIKDIKKFKVTASEEKKEERKEDE